MIAASFVTLAHADDRLTDTAANFMGGEVIFGSETSDGEVLWRMTSTSSIEECVFRSDALRTPVAQDGKAHRYTGPYYDDDPKYKVTRFVSFIDLARIAEHSPLIEFADAGYNVHLGYQSRSVITGTVPIVTLRRLASPEKYKSVSESKKTIPNEWATADNRTCSAQFLMNGGDRATQCFQALDLVSLSLTEIENSNDIKSHTVQGGVGWRRVEGQEVEYHATLGRVMIALPFASFYRASNLFNQVIDERCR